MSNNRSAWKAITIDYTALQTYDDSEQIIICLTQRQVAILKALLTTTYWLTRWTNVAVSDDELLAYVAQLDSQLDGNDCECPMLMFRDNPDDPCEVQYSQDGGETWATMFRKDVCRVPSEGDVTIINNTKIIITENNDTWNGDIINIAEDWEWVGDKSNNAICWAIDKYVDAICELAIANIQSGNDERRDNDDLWDTLRGIISTLAIGASTVIGIPAAAVGAFAWAVVAIADALYDDWVTRTYDQFEDDDARQAIKCAMYYSLVGKTVQFEDWRDSIQSYDPQTANEIAIWESVSVVNSDTDVYINYLLLTEDINSISESLPTCPCELRWEHTWNFVTHGLEVWTVDDLGTYVAGVGVEGELAPAGEDDTQNVIYQLRFDEEIPRVDKMEFLFDCDKGHFNKNVDAIWARLLPTLEFTANQGAVFTGDDQTLNWSFDLTHGTECWIGFNVCWTDTEDYGSILIKSVTFEGVGIDPFLGRDTS